MSTYQLVNRLKQSDEDYEWYPTTNEIIDIIKHDIESNKYSTHSILDCGAGDGRVLNALTVGKKYAIEKSKMLIESMDKDIFIVGTEFHQQTLLDKTVNIIFSNPPYSEFIKWSTKIIKESKAGIVYLVLPTRWKKCKEINEAIDLRNGEYEVIGKVNFSNGDREACVNVDIVRLSLSYSNSKTGLHTKIDPFALWFEENFNLSVKPDFVSDITNKSNTKKTASANLENELVAGRDIITSLEKLYQRDLDKLISCYKALEQIDSNILCEFNINLSNLREGLLLKVTGLKDVYWNLLFNNLDKVTNRLVSKKRSEILYTLTSNTQIDFSASNAYAVVIWVIKNANDYFDDQLIDIVIEMVNSSSVVQYKSNKKTFGDELWRYSRWNNMHEDINRFKLEYRIVVEILNHVTHLDDMRTVANNIGFDTTPFKSVADSKLIKGKKIEILFRNYETGQDEVLFDARSFIKGTLHIRFNQAFICKLNVEFGRLKGWLKSPKEASEELDIPFKQAVECFKSNIKLEVNNIMKLDFKNDECGDNVS